MTRAHIADPEIVRKIREGRPDDIRPCVGANVCINRVQAGGPLRCFHNTEAAREHEWGPASPAARPKRVAVVGAGPAGIEAARVAERGHQVTVYEKSDGIGGQLRLWAQAPQTREFAKSLAWFEHRLTQLQVSSATASARARSRWRSPRRRSRRAASDGRAGSWARPWNFGHSADTPRGVARWT
jgi:NADPH-dependent 2,4-dienoyl-CoA reductase/sulfur reductase-like enzyme